jgi:hypothetical protein
MTIQKSPLFQVFSITLSLLFFFLIVNTTQPFLNISQVYASGAQTQDQLKVSSNKDGVVYLTTEVDSASASSTVENTSISTPSGSLGFINLPAGFIMNVSELINLALRIALIIAVLLVFGSIIWGAIQWITSGGDKGKTEGARNRIFAAIVGLIIVCSSYAIFLIILHLVGIKDINDLFSMLQPGYQSTEQVQTFNASSSSQLRDQNLVK